MVRVYTNVVNTETGEPERRLIAEYTDEDWQRFKGYHKGMAVELDG